MTTYSSSSTRCCEASSTSTQPASSTEYVMRHRHALFLTYTARSIDLTKYFFLAFAPTLSVPQTTPFHFSKRFIHLFCLSHHKPSPLYSHHHLFFLPHTNYLSSHDSPFTPSLLPFPSCLLPECIVAYRFSFSPLSPHQCPFSSLSLTLALNPHDLCLSTYALPTVFYVIRWLLKPKNHDIIVTQSGAGWVRAVIFSIPLKWREKSKCICEQCGSMPEKTSLMIVP